MALSSQGQQENNKKLYVFEDLSTIRTITFVRSVAMSVIQAWHMHFRYRAECKDSLTQTVRAPVNRSQSLTGRSNETHAIKKEKLCPNNKQQQQ